jgi:transposase-like protein
MPRKNQPKRPQSEIDKLVKRHIEGGESVAALAKEAKVSKPGFYLWVNKFKKEILEGSMRREMSPQAIKDAEVLKLTLEIQSLKQDLSNCRNKLFNYMLSHNDL